MPNKTSPWHGKQNVPKARPQSRKGAYMRLFIAIIFNNEVNDYSYNIIKELKSYSTRGNFVDYNNLHLTLSFLGEMRSAEVAQNAMNMAIKAANVEEFIITIKGIGKFSRREGDVLFAKIEYNEYLYRLQKCLTKELIACGVKVEDREYTPHLTLAKKVIMKDIFEMTDFTNKLSAIQQKVDKISLMRSDRINEKLVYTQIYEKRLN